MATQAEGRSIRAEEPLSDWERKRRQILDGAALVFSTRGYKQGTTTEVAATIGLSQPAIYHYVGSKADLLREIALQVDRDMLGALERGFGASPDPREQLRGVIREFTRAVIDNRLTFAVYRQEARSLEPEVALKVQADEQAFIASVDRLVVKLQGTEQLPAGPSKVVTHGILTMVSEVYRWYRTDGPLDADGIADALCDLVGLRAGDIDECP